MFVERESGTYLKYIFPYKLIVNQHQINVRLQINRDLQRMLPLFHDKYHSINAQQRQKLCICYNKGFNFQIIMRSCSWFS